MKKRKDLLITTGLIVSAVLFFAVLSQFYTPDQQIFITDHYFINPKSQPFHFILIWFATIAAIIFAIWLGKLIAFFLWTRGLLFPVVGTFMILGAVLLGYVALVLQQNVDSKGSFIVMAVIVLFAGGLGALMLLSPFLGKKK